MGYYAHSERSDFCILRDKFSEALEALHNEYPEYKSNDDLPDIITEFGLTVEIDERGDITEMYYEYSKFHNDEIKAVFSVLAPFVASGSYITFRGEDDSAWAYYFGGSGYKEYPGETIFPGMPMTGPRRRAQEMPEQGGQ